MHTGGKCYYSLIHSTGICRASTMCQSLPQPLVYHLLFTKYYVQAFINITSFNHHHSPQNICYYSRFPHKEMKSGKDKSLAQSHIARKRQSPEAKTLHSTLSGPCLFVVLLQGQWGTLPLPAACSLRALRALPPVCLPHPKGKASPLLSLHSTFPLFSIPNALLQSLTDGLLSMMQSP